jgi:DNA-directed RNA polymerase sigma subunit (sigma70/sigma32)
MGPMVVDVETLRTRYVESLDALEHASGRTVAALEDARESRVLARHFVHEGRPLAELEREIEVQPLRASVSDALSDLERARHETQRLLFQLLHAEGQTLADIGRTFGISRQLVSRLVNEPDPVPV